MCDTVQGSKNYGRFLTESGSMKNQYSTLSEAIMPEFSQKMEKLFKESGKSAC